MMKVLDKVSIRELLYLDIGIFLGAIANNIGWYWRGGVNQEILLKMIQIESFGLLGLIIWLLIVKIFDKKRLSYLK